jgi:anti-sigma-K factor RskA
MTDHQEEMLALHALRTLTPEEVRLLESESRYDARMRETLGEFEETVGEMGRLLPNETPPEEMRAQVLARVKAHARGNMTPFTVPFRLLRSPVLAWAAAAAIAVGAFGLWKRNHQLEQRADALAQAETAALKNAESVRAAQQALEQKVAELSGTITDLTAERDRLQKSFAVSSMQVATLRSSLKRYEEGTAMVVWNQAKQEGLLKLENMPEVQANKDYQLWVICKECQHPVSAGVVKLKPDGTTVITFKPSHHIAQAMKFAISVEAQGGANEKPEGPVIFASR